MSCCEAGRLGGERCGGTGGGEWGQCSGARRVGEELRLLGTRSGEASVGREGEEEEDEGGSAILWGCRC